MKVRGKSALVAAGLVAGGLLSGGANAADLGGNCCADLEERVAELEATTARKGNRKVSMTISGWVSQQLMYFDNGAVDDVYVTDIGSTIASHVKFSGSAQVTPDVTAGYVLHLEVMNADPITAGNPAWRDNGPYAYGITSDDTLQNNAVKSLYSYWFLKSKSLGQVMVGHIPQASEHAAMLVDGSGSLLQANWTPLNGLGIALARNGRELLLDADFGLPTLVPNVGFPLGAAMWCGSSSLPTGGNCAPVPINGVRYDSPTFGGFSASATWGEDDFWDVALRYAGEHGGFKVAATAAYNWNGDEGMYTGFNTVTGLSNVVKRDASYFQIGAYLQHVSSGLFLYGSYGKEENDNILVTQALTDAQPSGDVWYLKAGIRRNWVPLGATVLYGEYSERNDMYHPDLSAFGVTGSNLTQWGLGAVQEIDAAAMSLWLTYKNYDASFEGAPPAISNLDDINVVAAGAMISF
ncbi:MAG: hypothetical protein JNN24_04655 [Hyphomicrobium zavarzinii]|uniref:hypothetical protein n=1 Tax=Hyphomicrobium TaxID=81 RepID=UPI001A4B606C|nr:MULTISPECIES: hypothetical protein [Hyphomicrobium]MBL8845042.1 hypothetical protein [Hyphomicrobium zavarzinii]WBT37205.1 hypothetical protein PE058_16280 [Hyphomicrobium sp. DMF-1]HML43994.1 hypothetical protein [Hyphomicrobium zavarzinii]